jgi:hypothetical protein
MDHDGTDIPRWIIREFAVLACLPSNRWGPTDGIAVFMANKSY